MPATRVLKYCFWDVCFGTVLYHCNTPGDGPLLSAGFLDILGFYCHRAALQTLSCEGSPWQSTPSSVALRSTLRLRTVRPPPQVVEHSSSELSGMTLSNLKSKLRDLETNLIARTRAVKKLRSVCLQEICSDCQPPTKHHECSIKGPQRNRQ